MLIYKYRHEGEDEGSNEGNAAQAAAKGLAPQFCLALGGFVGGVPDDAHDQEDLQRPQIRPLVPISTEVVIDEKKAVAQEKADGNEQPDDARFVHDVGKPGSDEQKFYGPAPRKKCHWLRPAAWPG